MNKNRLQYETSPYLLQHSTNPVDWYPWGEEALKKAEKENKLLIISIGYAACHWCHVMERECFENEEAARFMNENFVSIKVDREERPDIDQIYMEAVQILTGSGGWPLNVIALPDGRPIFGGTYFPVQNWLKLLDQILEYAEEKGDKLLEQSVSLTEALNQSLLDPEADRNESFDADFSYRVFTKMLHLQDAVEGGQMGAPKFPMPAALQFLLRYSYSSGNVEGGDQVFLTLDRMADGGIYDQIGGGFARYSVDRKWKVPHFEKMLYDNGQLMSLYSDAFKRTGKDKYRQVVFETAAFIEREMTSPEGAFYSSIDADSDGVEGLYYIWTENELDQILGDRSDAVKKYYSVTSTGNWEKGKNILHIRRDVEVPDDLIEVKKKLLGEREKRNKPSLDNKILTSWNGLMIKGYADAYKAFHRKAFLDRAVRAGQYIIDKLFVDGRLYRTLRNGKPYIDGFLDDYAFTVQAFIALYEITFDSPWLEIAGQLTRYVLSHFHDSRSPLLFYKSDVDSPLIARKKEIIDNVIPSSNSQTAENLFRMGMMLHNDQYVDRAESMVRAVRAHCEKGSIHFAHWNSLINTITEKPYVATFSGKQKETLRREIEQNYIPDLMFFSSGEENDSEKPGTVMICRDNYCLKPVNSSTEALAQLGISAPFQF
ncbi:thioredoxin domain-containing protein [Spirochaeta isovalerica]|uniref:Spermatogenesis-associated protein 20-like TRX domain-containing protein n=1 Tax=Spirochaeta isovalerica TaxID=150 RepID=A0A841R7D4_9SPIO|nr:thioredoxin domain-containing protein [Spirochaeta isovalerica]MBB6478950.1 hypothetical protein [Spirochaeta isovalerica]